jgi:hypothetical protein
MKKTDHLRFRQSNLLAVESRGFFTRREIILTISSYVLLSIEDDMKSIK